MKTKKIALLSFFLLTAASIPTGCKAESNETQNNDNNTSAMTDKSQQTTAMPSENDVTVDIETTMGNIRVLIFGDTPAHKNNFLKLVNEGFYNGTLFHRVINEFMVQAGDPDSKEAPAGKMLGSGDPGYTIEAEIDYPRHFHKRGALAAARTGDNVNPEKRSSGSQFYIVTGKTYNDSTLMQMEKQMEMAQKQNIFSQLTREHAEQIKQLRMNRDQQGLAALQEQLIAITEDRYKAHPAVMSDNVKEAYKTVGGTPHLDGNYTVFGEVISGMDVVDKIQAVETDRNDRPKEDVKILSMTVVK